MRRAVASTVLIITLSAGFLAAQRGGMTFRGGASASSHLTSGRGVRGSFSTGFSHDHFHRNRGGFLYPYWFPYDEPYDYEGPDREVVVRDPAPAVQPPAPQPPAQPKLIEVPGAANSAAAKPVPPAIFILTSGERLETSRFLLRANDLSVTVNRQQRTIPLGQVDLDATVAANHERGINLEIPNDANEISLRF